MKANAILVRPLDIIKVEVDFSTDQGLYDALDAERLSTIHTAKTQEISSLLGIHLIGFVDRNGDDINNDRACNISGYDYIGSFMLLCKADDKLNYLPFTEAELETVYTYLTTGKVVSPSIKNEAAAFFNKHGINPITPEFGIEPQAIFLKEYPNVIVLKYDFSSFGDDGLFRVGEQLFAYSSRLLSELEEYDLDNAIRMSPEQSYLLRNYTTEDHTAYYVLIEVIKGRPAKSVLMDVVYSLSNGETTAVLDEPEEEEDLRDSEDDINKMSEEESRLQAWLEEHNLEDMILPNISGLAFYPDSKPYLAILRYQYSDRDEEYADAYVNYVDSELDDMGSGILMDKKGRYFIYVRRNKAARVMVIHVQILNIGNSNNGFFIGGVCTDAALEKIGFDKNTLLEPAKEEPSNSVAASFLKQLGKGHKASTSQKKYENEVSPAEFDEEDEYEYNDDLLLPYVLRIRAKINWPNLKDTRCEYDEAFPLFMMSQEPIVFSYFADKIKVKNIDTWNGTADLYIMLDRPIKVHLELEKEYRLLLDYYSNEKETSHRVGELIVSLEQFEFDVDKVLEGKLQIVEELKAPGEYKVGTERMEIKNPNTILDEKDHSVCSDLTYLYYDPYLVDIEKNAVVFIQKYYVEERKEFDHIYFVVELGKENVFYDTSWDDEQNGQYEFCVKSKLVR